MVKIDYQLCKKKGLQSLRNHLRQVHLLKDIVERRRWLAKAKYIETTKLVEINRQLQVLRGEHRIFESASEDLAPVHRPLLQLDVHNHGIPLQPM